jgi:PGF-pre-PGF domain-containing protein
LSLNIQNSGETTAQFGTITVSPSDFSISSGCSPSSIEGGQSLGITCAITASSSATTGSRTLTLTITPTNTEFLTKTVTVTVSAIPTPTVTPPSPGSGGSVRTSGTTVSYAKGNANITIPSIAVGKMANITIAKTEDVAFRQINISVSNAVNNIKIVINKLAAEPASVTHKITGKIYNYISVDKTNITDAGINKVFIKFAVNKTWLSQNGVANSNISLYRWTNSKWNELTTNYISEDVNEVFYQAESLGFSYFLIGTKAGEVVTTDAPTGAAIACTESWACADWSVCTNGKQTRTCTDANNCGTTANKPVESQDCTAIAEITGIAPWVYLTVAFVIILIIAAMLFIFRKKINSKNRHV